MKGKQNNIRVSNRNLFINTSAYNVEGILSVGCVE